MQGAVGELVEFADQLAAKLAELERYRDQFQAVENAARAVGRSWSGSNIGYHARVYYEGFQPPPANAVFSVEWGLEERWPVNHPDPGWGMYADEEVRAEIAGRAGVRAADLVPILAPLRQFFDEQKDNLLSMLMAIDRGGKDPFLAKKIEDIQATIVLDPNSMARNLGPHGQFVTRDTEAGYAGRQVATHFAVLAVPFSASALESGLRALEQTARLTATHVRRLDPKGRSGVQTGGAVTFIGHGRSPAWRELKDFLKDRLGLAVSEFNAVSAAGVLTVDRLTEMLNTAAFAFIVMTGEDDQADGNVHARQNVIHEAGLFQGRLGFSKAIILLEDGCADFSNIHGLGVIRFPRGNISAGFEEVRQVLARENIT